MTDSDRYFRTQDMTLVILLCHQEMPYDRMELSGREVTWFFHETEELRREVAEYRDDQAMVDPKSFLRHRVRVIREMHDFKERQVTAA